MKKFIIAIVVLSVVAVVWASRTPKKTSDYGDSACDSTPEIFGSGPARQLIKGVQVLSEQICHGFSGGFPLNCSTTARDFVLPGIAALEYPAGDYALRHLGQRCAVR